MNSKYLFFLILVFLSACTEVYFTETQPAGKKQLKEIPVTFHGWYVEKEGKDSIHISFRGFDIDDESAILSDSIVLTKWKKYYFLNLLEKEKGYWEVYQIKKINENEIELSIIDGDDNESINKLRQMTTVTTQPSSEGKVDYYVVSPTSKTFKKIVSGSVFKPSVIYQKAGN